MNNTPMNEEKRQRPNLIDTSNLDTNNDDFFSDLNSTLVDDLDKSMEKKVQAKKDKEAKELEKSKKIKSKMPIVIGVTAAVIVVVIVIIVVMTIIKQGNYVLNTIDSGVIVEQQPIFEDTSNKFLVNVPTKDNTDSTEVDITNYNYNIVELGDADTFKQGETILVDVIVNTKEAWEDVLSDHETQLFLTYKGSTVGYDEVIKSVESYNETSNNKITLPSKEDYSTSGLDLVLVEFEVSYPENFPTYNSDGKVFVIPQLELVIKGLCSELLVDETDLTKSLDEYVVVNDFIYELSAVTKLHTLIEEAHKSDVITYKFLASMPYNTTKNLYEIKLDIVVDNKTQTLSIDNYNMPVVNTEEQDIIEDEVVEESTNTEEEIENATNENTETVINNTETESTEVQ